MRLAPILLALTLTLQGCGSKGPLYLPAPQAQPGQETGEAKARQEKQ